MKYSIRGNLSIADETPVIELLNSYTLWKLDPKRDYEANLFIFEAWINNLVDKDNLFNGLKPFVDQFGEVVDWHECSHDELTHTPCVIAEEYRK